MGYMKKMKVLIVKIWIQLSFPPLQLPGELESNKYCLKMIGNYSFSQNVPAIINFEAIMNSSVDFFMLRAANLSYLLVSRVPLCSDRPAL
jgi:hypothetical protein